MFNIESSINRYHDALEYKEQNQARAIYNYVQTGKTTKPDSYVSSNKNIQKENKKKNKNNNKNILTTALAAISAISVTTSIFLANRLKNISKNLPSIIIK